MTCESCAANVRRALEKVSGVTGVEVLYAEGRARVQLDPEVAVGDAPLLDAVAEAGSQAHVLDPTAPVASAAGAASAVRER